MTRAVTYARVSTGEQSTIDAQVKICGEYAERQGWEIVGEPFTDIQSGLRDDRSGWQRLLHQARLKQFDIVIVYKTDRFGRDTAASFPAVKDLRRCGVKLHSTVEGDNRFVQGLFLLLAEEESHGTSIRTQSFMRAKAEGGRWLSRAPRGYDLAEIPEAKMTAEERGRKRRPKTLERNSDAPKVAELFQRYADGASYQALREEAERMGLVDPKQMYFRLQHLLRNPVYRGLVVYGRRYNGELDDEPKGLRPEEEWITVPGLHEPIVDQATWDKVQARINGHRDAQVNLAKSTYLLTHLLWCGDCGARMHGMRRTRPSGHEYKYYRCFTRVTKGGCGRGNVNAPAVEQAVKQAVTPLLMVALDPQSRALSKKLLREVIAGMKQPETRQTKRLQAERGRLEKQRVNLARDLSNDDIDREMYRKLMREADERLTTIDSDLAQANGGFDPEEAFRQVWALAEQIPWPPESDEQWRTAIGSVVGRVEVDAANRVQVRLKTPFDRVPSRAAA